MRGEVFRLTAGLLISRSRSEITNNQKRSSTCASFYLMIVKNDMSPSPLEFCVERAQLVRRIVRSFQHEEELHLHSEREYVSASIMGS